MIIKNRDWAKESSVVIKRAIRESNHNISNIVNVTGCVGSGKTYVGFNGFEEFILAHPDEKTFQMFVCPRIKLCNQQMKEWKNEYFDLISALKEKGINVIVKEYDCESEDTTTNRDSVTNSEYICEGQHVIYFICDKSLWDTESRMNHWKRILINNLKYGRLNGFIVYDENHNYEKHQKDMYGKEIH